MLALPALVLWVLTPHTSVSWGQALGVASAGWYLGHGAGLTVDDLVVSLTPLGLWLLALAVSARSARRLLERVEASDARSEHRLTRQVLPGFLLGYAGFALFAGLLTFAGPARPRLLTTPVLLLVPVLALVWALIRRHRAGQAAGPLGTWLDRGPRWLTRAFGPGVLGATLLLGCGTLLLLVMVVARLSTITGLHAALGAGLVGGVVLTLGQLLIVPNLAVWGVAWLAGPGFQIADGATVSLSGATPGLLPLVPVLGALPSDGTWPRWLLVVLALPVVVGAVVSWRVCRSLPRLASWRTKAEAAAAAVATSALVLTLLAALGSGSVGVDRLRSVGVNPLLLGGALLVELGVGAGAYLFATQLRLRLRR